VKSFVKLLVNNKKTLLTDLKIQSELLKLKDVIVKFENSIWEARSKNASKKLTQMSEEDRRILLMWPEEKEFFLDYKKKNPENPWAYFKEYQKKVQQQYKAPQKRLQKQPV
jgi:hypothetical protein